MTEAALSRRLYDDSNISFQNNLFIFVFDDVVADRLVFRMLLCSNNLAPVHDDNLDSGCYGNTP